MSVCLSACPSVRLCACLSAGVCAITTSTTLGKLSAVFYRYAYMFVYIFLLGFVNIYAYIYIHAFMYLCTDVYSPIKHAHKHVDNDPLMNQRFADLPNSPSGTPTKKTVASELTSVSIGPTVSHEKVTDVFPVPLGAADELGLTNSSFTAMAWVYNVAADSPGDLTIFGTYEQQLNRGLHLVVS